MFIAGHNPYPERARELRSGSQSQREIRFILPARGASRIIIENIEIFRTLMTLRKLSFGLNYFDITFFCLMNIGIQITKENILLVMI